MRRRSPARDRGLVYIPEPASMGVNSAAPSRRRRAHKQRGENMQSLPRGSRSSARTAAGKEARVSGWVIHTGLAVSGSALLHLLLHSDTQEPTLSVRCQGNASMRRRQRRCGATQVRWAMARRWLVWEDVVGRRSDTWGQCLHWFGTKKRKAVNMKSN